MTKTKNATRRAIGIIRVSPDNDRGGETQHSPEDQRDAIARYCTEHGWKMLETLDEVDVSGGWKLERRKGLRPAIEAIEAGRADVIVASRFDRLVRSVHIHSEITERVEQAGDDIYAVDSGYITNGNASSRMTSAFLGAVSEYHRNTTRERTHEARVRAIANGIPLTHGAPPGYLRPTIGTRPNGSLIHGPLKVDPKLAPIIVQAFEMGAEGETVKTVRHYLREHGVERTHTTVRDRLANRTYLGELHAGDLVNLSAHEPIVDVALFDRVQRVKVPSGGSPGTKSDRLLARLGVLRCASCNARMFVGETHGGKYHTYRCPSTSSSDCEHGAAISARMIEPLVVKRTRELLADEEGVASAQTDARQAAAQLEHAQSQRDALVAILDPTEASDRARLEAATLARNEAREKVERLGSLDVALSVNASRDWSKLTFSEQRSLIRDVWQSVTVAPGYGVERVTFKAFSE